MSRPDAARPEVTFRLLTDDDLPMLHGWLNEPGVVRWWEGDDVSWDGVVAEYGSGRDDPDTEHWLGVIDGEPIGWICCWPAPSGIEESAAWFERGVDRTAAGIDYLVAAPARRGQGLGSAMIRSFVTEVVFGRHPTWTQAAASPYTANVASCRALARAGFTEWAQIPTADDDGPCTLFVIGRDAIT